jgi:hypothetical protein
MSTIQECISQVTKGGVTVYVYAPVLGTSIRVAKGVILKLLREHKKRTHRDSAIRFTVRDDVLIIDTRFVS